VSIVSCQAFADDVLGRSSLLLPKVLTNSFLLEIPNLFHAIFDRARHSVTVYNNRCEKVVTRALLENH
jgi:hypothetical protein